MTEKTFKLSKTQAMAIQEILSHHYISYESDSGRVIHELLHQLDKWVTKQNKKKGKEK